MSSKIDPPKRQRETLVWSCPEPTYIDALILGVKNEVPICFSTVAEVLYYPDFILHADVILREDFMALIG